MNYSATFPDAQPFVGVVENTVSALRLVQAAKMGLIPRIVRRLNDSERQHLIVPGAVLVFSVEESGIKRWTDGRLWSPSRIVGNFLVYREMHEKTGNRTQKSHASPESSPRRGDIQWNADANRLRSDPNSRSISSVANGTFKPDGLIKKTITVTIEGTDLHLISYYTHDDIVTNRLKRLATRPDIACLVLEPRIFRLGSFRSPPKVIIGPNGKSMIAPETEVDSPQETLADGSSLPTSGSPEYPTVTTSSVVANSRPIQSPHQDGNSFNPGYTPDWRGEYESAPMIDRYRQDAHWVTTQSSAETHGIDGYPDHSGPDEQAHVRREQSWRGSPELQYPEIYTQSQLDRTVHTQREVAGPSDGRVYDGSVYVDQSPGQRTHAPQVQPIGSAYLLGWPTSARHEYSPTDTAGSEPSHPHLTLPSTREIYSAGDHWPASTSSTNEYAVSSLRQQATQAFPDPGQTYYTYTDEGAGHNYEIEEQENDRFPRG